MCLLMWIGMIMFVDLCVKMQSEELKHHSGFKYSSLLFEPIQKMVDCLKGIEPIKNLKMEVKKCLKKG